MAWRPKTLLNFLPLLPVMVGCNAELYNPTPVATASPSTPVASLILQSTLALTGFCTSSGVAFQDCTDLTKSGSYLYVADRHVAANGAGGQILIINAQDPSNPAVTATYNTPGVQGLFALGTRLLTAGYFATNLEILDLSNPTLLTRIGFIANNGYDKPTVNANYAFSGNYNGTLDSIDISDPTNPVNVASVPTGNPDTLPVLYHGGYVYSAGKKAAHNLQATSVINPLNPSVLSSTTLGGDAGGMTSIAASGNFLFVSLCDSSPSNAFSIFDVTYPASPVLLSSTNLSTNSCDAAATQIRGGVAIKDNFAFVGTDSLRLFDISNPAQPALLATALPQELINAVFLSGRYLYALSGSRSAMFIFDTGY